jgi:hypothetical protein
MVAMKMIPQIAVTLALVVLGLGCAAQDTAPGVEDVATSQAEIINRDPGGGCWWDEEAGLCCYRGSSPSHPWGCVWCTSDPSCD